MSFQITPIRESFIKQVREQGIDDLGQAVEYSLAQGGEPCRDVLRRAKPGEKLILASYCPFSQQGPYREYGPVFILAENTEEEIDYSELAVNHKNEQQYFVAPFVLRGYDSKERIIDAAITSLTEAKSQVEFLFNNPQVNFVLARFAAYGCYALRLDRRGLQP